MSDKNFEVELQPVEIEINEETKSAPISQEELTVKQYVYNKNGKEFKVMRKYAVKKTNSMKTKDNKQKVADYIEEHKQKYLDTVSHKQVSTLIEDIKNDLGINISYTGGYNLLINHGVKIV